MAIKISFGINNEVTRDVAEYPTVGNVIGDKNLRQFLGFGDNIEARLNGLSAESGSRISDGDSIELITKANDKG